MPTFLLLITAVTFVAVYQFSSRYKLTPLWCAGIIAVIPFMFSTLMRFIYGADMMHVIAWSDVVILMLQFATAFIVFYKLQYDDTVEAWLTWGALGLITVTFVIPPFVKSFIYL